MKSTGFDIFHQIKQLYKNKACDLFYKLQDIATSNATQSKIFFYCFVIQIVLFLNKINLTIDIFYINKIACSGIKPLNPNKQGSWRPEEVCLRWRVCVCVCRPEPSCQSLNVSVSAPVLTARMPNGQIRWAHEDSESAFSRGNLVETRRQMQGQLSVKKPYKLSRRG